MIVSSRDWSVAIFSMPAIGGFGALHVYAIVQAAKHASGIASGIQDRVLAAVFNSPRIYVMELSKSARYIDHLICHLDISFCD